MIRCCLTFAILLATSASYLLGASSWTGTDLGPVAITGSETMAPEGVTMTAAGTDIWGTSDEGRFLYRSMTGDGEIFVRVEDLEFVHGWAKAGVMIRGSLAANSAHAFVARTGTNGVVFQRRRTADGSSTHLSGGGSVGPVWVRLRRTGNVFEAAYSADGSWWDIIGSDTIAMPETVFVGLALTSHDPVRVATARFAQIGLTSSTAPLVRWVQPLAGAVLPLGETLTLSAETDLPGAPIITYRRNEHAIAVGAPATAAWTPDQLGTQILVAEAIDGDGVVHRSAPLAVEVSALSYPWLTRAIGTVVPGGSAEETAAGFTLRNSGSDIWGQRDEFRFLYQRVSGDCQIVTRVSALDAPHAWTKAGVMVRATTSAGSQHVLLAATGNSGVALQYRSLDTSTSTHIGGGSDGAPLWLKLERRGSMFTAWRSSNGWSWTQVGTVELGLDATVLVGLALTSHDRSTFAEAAFTHTRVLPLPSTPAIAWQSPSAGAAYQIGTAIPLAVDLLDSALTGPVTFRVNGLPIATGAPTAATWSGAGLGIHHLTAEATTSDGVLRVSEPRAVWVTDLPSPWISESIGGFEPGGSGTITAAGDASLRNAGRDIWGQRDEFHFVYQYVRGDCQIITRVASLDAPHVWTKAGLMMRAHPGTGSPHVLAAVTGGSGVAHQYRQVETGTSSHVGGGRGEAPIWLKLERRGSVFTTWRSSNGWSWTQVGTVEMTLGDTVLVGLALSSHDRNAFAEAEFTHTQVLPLPASPSIEWQSPSVGAAYQHGDAIPLAVDLLDPDLSGPVIFRVNRVPVATGSPTTATWTAAAQGIHHLTAEAMTSGGILHVSEPRPVWVTNMPSPWVSEPIGAVGPDGSGSITAAGTATLRNAGDDIWNRQDAFRFVHRPMVGNLRIQARIDRLEHVHPWTKVGVMVRAGTDANSAHAIMAITGSNGVAFQYRSATGDISRYLGGGAGDEPIWLRLERRGNDLIGYRSLDAVTWVEVGRATIPLGQTLRVGLALTSHDRGVYAEAALSEVLVESLATTPLPAIGFAAASQVVPENAGTISLPIVLSHAVAVPVTVTWTVSGTATSGSDYIQPTNLTTVIPVGQTTVGIPLEILHDAEVEGDEILAVTLTASVGAIVAGITTTTVTIQDVLINEAPTLARVASATPNPVIGTTTALSVLGADDGGEAALLYTWSVNGPAAVEIAPNTTNAAKDATATFTAPGSYTVNVMVTDAYGATVSDTVTVTVHATPTTMAVSPSAATVVAGATQVFQVAVADQFLQPIQPLPEADWSVDGGGLIDATGLFTAGTTPADVGTFTVTAQAAGLNATAAVTVVAPTNFAPTIETGPSAAPAPVTGTTALMTVLGADDQGEAGLTYTWSATGPAVVQFTANGSNLAKTSTATFTTAGSYDFTVVIVDADGASVAGELRVEVVATPAVIAIAPASVNVVRNGTQAFAATVSDQFGTVIPEASVSWAVDALGSITEQGIFTAEMTLGLATVTATRGVANGEAMVTVINSAPTVAEPIAVNPLPIQETSATFTVLAADDAGEEHVQYGWSATGPALVTFAPTGTNAAKQTTATFSAAGDYTVVATLTDADGESVQTSLPVTVAATASALTVTPATVTIPSGATTVVTAELTDQFGSAMTMPADLAWSSTGPGTLTPQGPSAQVTGDTAGGVVTVTATVGAFTAQAVVTVNPPSALPRVSFRADASAVRENVGTTSIAVALSAAATTQTQISYAITGGTATPGDDFIASTGELLFAPGTTTASIPVQVLDDAISDPSETVIITLSEPVGLEVGVTMTHVLTLKDTQPVRITVEPLVESVMENDAVGSAFRFSRTGEVDASVALALYWYGNAVEGTHYTGTRPSTFTIPAGQSWADVPLVPINNETIGSDVEVNVYIESTGGGEPIDERYAAMSILDDEEPIISIRLNPAVFVEGRTGYVYVGLINEQGIQVARKTGRVLAWQLSGDGIDTTDFQTPISGSVTTYPGYAGEQSFSVIPRDDGIEEGPENLVVTVTSNALTAQATGSVVDLATVTIDRTAATVVESATEPESFRFTRTGATTEELSVPIYWNSSATANEDFEGTLPTAIVFAPGQTEVLVPIQPKDDAIIESDEFVRFYTSNGDRYVLQYDYNVTSMTILDDEEPVLSVRLPTSDIYEGSTVYAYIGLRDASGSAISRLAPQTIAWNVTGPSAEDWSSPTSGSVVTRANSTSEQAVTLTAVNDGSEDGPEAFVLTATLGDQSAQAAGQILDRAMLTLSVSHETTAEDAGEEVTFTLTRTGVLQQPTTVALSWSSAASAGQDFTETLPSAVTIPVGESSVSLTITPIDDALIESDEAIRLYVYNTSAYGISGSTNVGFILLDDENPILHATTSYGIQAEGHTAQVTLSLRNTQGSTIFRQRIMPISYSISGIDAADVGIPLTGTTGIPVNSYSSTWSMPILSDGLSEDPETASITYAQGSSTATVAIDIIDLDGVQFDPSVVTMQEPGAGEVARRVNASMTVGWAAPEDWEISVQIRVNNSGTATWNNSWNTAGEHDLRLVNAYQVPMVQPVDGLFSIPVADVVADPVYEGGPEGIPELAHADLYSVNFKRGSRISPTFVLSQAKALTIAIQDKVHAEITVQHPTPDQALLGDTVEVAFTVEADEPLQEVRVNGVVVASGSVNPGPMLATVTLPHLGPNSIRVWVATAQGAIVQKNVPIVVLPETIPVFFVSPTPDELNVGILRGAPVARAYVETAGEINWSVTATVEPEGQPGAAVPAPATWDGQFLDVSIGERPAGRYDVHLVVTTADGTRSGSAAITLDYDPEGWTPDPASNPIIIHHPLNGSTITVLGAQ